MIPQDVFEEIMTRAAENFPLDFITQRSIINAQVEAYEQIHDETWGGRGENDAFPPRISPEAEIKSIREELGLPPGSTSVGILTKIRELKKTRTPEMISFSELFDTRTGRADLKLEKYAAYVATLGEKLAEIKNERSKRITNKDDLEKLIAERNAIAGELNEIARFLAHTEWTPGGYVMGGIIPPESGR